MLNGYMFKTVFLVLVLGMVGMNSFTYGEAVASLNDTAPSFVVYYGVIEEENIDVIASYDVAVVEPKGTTKDINEAIRDQDTEVFGYLSVMQVEYFDDFKLSAMTDEDFMMENGKKMVREKSGNFIGDMRSENYREMLIAAIEDRIIDKGYDGVFLDTVSYVSRFDDETNAELEAGFIEFVKTVKKRHPELKIFQNRGFDVYLAGSSEYVDYLLYENFMTERINKYNYYKELVNNLNIAAEASKGKIFALSMQDELTNLISASHLDWSYYYTEYETFYTEIPNAAPTYVAIN